MERRLWAYLLVATFILACFLQFVGTTTVAGKLGDLALLIFLLSRFSLLVRMRSLFSKVVFGCLLTLDVLLLFLALTATPFYSIWSDNIDLPAIFMSLLLISTVAGICAFLDTSSKLNE